MAEDQSGRLDKAMSARRRELGLRWKDVADQAGIAEETLRNVRRGGRRAAIRTTHTEAKIERALHWQRGSIKAVRDGGEPTPLPGLPPAPVPVPITYSGGGCPDFVKHDPGYRAIWEIPAELLSVTERRYAIHQIELLRWTRTGTGTGEA